jgi:hypothetical protein
LDGSVDGTGVAVGGACIGDTVSAIPVNEITQVLPNRPLFQHEPGEDESQGMMTRESPLEEVRKHGGNVYAGTVTYAVANGRIRQIWVRGAFLSTLPFGKEDDIERVLGPSKGTELKLGWVVHHYPERNLSVAWHAQENRLEHVALGPVSWEPLVLGAKDVLHEWLEAAHAGLQESEWKEPEDRTTSQWVRHARVMSLLRAFGLGSPKSFAEGDFLKGKPVAEYPLATQALRQLPKGARETDSQDVLGRLFWWLLVYRTEAQKLLKLNSGWLAASNPGILAALRLTGDATEGVAAALEEVEALLVELIDPSGKQVPERELIERWGWPHVDLEQLLMDEL